MFGGGGGGNSCLICHKKDGWGLKIKNVGGFLEGTSSVLDRHLEVFWLLGKVLEVPGEQLARFLEGCPDNLEEWIKICGKCGELVKECKVVYQQLLEVNRRWIGCRLKVVGKIKETWEDGGDLEEMEVDIARECRDFVKKYEYQSWRNPFAAGDVKAVELANKTVIKEEVEETSGASSEEEYSAFSPASGSEIDSSFGEDNEKDEDYKPEVKDSTRDFGFTKGGRKRRNTLAPSQIPVTCHLCNKTLANQHGLSSHLDIVHHIKTSKSSSYPFCTYTRKSPKDQEEALVIPGNIFRVKCPVANCTQTWSSLPSYLTHMENEHTSEEKCGVTCNAKVLECTECQKMFRTLEHAEDHLAKHDKTLKRDKICEFCGAAFVTKRRLLTHKHVKTECRQRQGLKPKENESALCTICGKTCSSNTSLNQHVYKCHRKSVPKPEEKLVNCQLCSKRLNAKSLKLHLFMVHKIGKGNYECPKCQKTFAKRLLLDRHTRSLCGTIKKPKGPVPASELPSESPICKKRIRSSLKRHLNRVRSIQTRNRDPKPLPDNKFRIKCPVPDCPQTWSNPSTDILSYRSHLATQHTQEEKAEMSKRPNFLECLECGKSFQSFDRGRIHLYQHDKSLKKPIVCDTCGASFLHKESLKMHKETSRQCGKQKRLPESEAKIICDICGNGYANKNSLQGHIRYAHKGNKPTKCKVVCDVCGISLAKSSLNQHKKMSLHCRRLQGFSESDASIICNICGKRYANRFALQKHIRERHEGIFKEKCEHCGKALESKYKLKIHLTTVHKIGNFKGKEHKCPEEGCEKVFYSKQVATNHWYGVHKQGEPEFKCEQCDKAFYAPGYLAQHINVVHKGYRWKPKNKKNN